jgi:two-component system, chemotaxis family, sensor histidine kinase and response regulator WspE
LSEKLDDLRQKASAAEEGGGRGARGEGSMEQELGELACRVDGCRQFLSHRLQELEVFDRRSAHRSQRMYLEVVRMRMRPFSDGVRHFPRMVRDLARTVGKRVRLEILGEMTQVDRDILERLESPLAHLLRNAVDHGCETPEQRQRAGKPPEGTIRLEARHSAGMLQVTVADDGAGVHPERVREAILKRKLAGPAVAEGFTEAELLEFLFLPGFTLKDAVTEISGRGVGLDVVQNMVRSVRGSLRVTTQPGRGMRIQLQLPLTLSVLRALLVEVAGEPYAFPLTHIARAVKLAPGAPGALDPRRHFQFEGQPVGLLAADRVFNCGTPKPPGDDLNVVVLGDRNARYGLVVDRFLGERELVVQPLDTRLGKVRNISAGALMEDGAPVLIVDVDDLLRSIETLLAEGLLSQVQPPGLELTGRKQKRVLAVDDSLTVRELVRKLLANRGYQADVAIDGMEGWNAVRTGRYDLVIADVDMPRLDGIELATLIKKDPQLKSLPILIVSYKDSEQDRLRGLEAGADYYLTKASFDDESLLRAVVDLIGEPET